MMNVTSVQHTTHVSFDPETGRFVGLPKEWEKAVMSTFGLPVALYVSEVVPGYASRIPKVLVKMRQFLHDKEGFKQHGIFRVAPDQVERDVVLAQLAAGTFQDCRDVHCIATAIKVWFRDLPTPLFQRLDIEAVKNCNSDEEALSLLNAQIEPSKSLALWLMDVCCDVVEFAKVNAMSAKNMSIVVSPNLIRLETRLGDPLEVFKLSKRFTDFFERLLNVRMKQRGSKVAPRKISVRPVAPRAAALSLTKGNSNNNNSDSNSSRESELEPQEDLPPAPDSDDELPPENPPPEPDSDEDYPPPPPPRPSPAAITPPGAKAGFVLPLVNPLEMLSFQLAEYFPLWATVLEPRIPPGPCVECDQAGIIHCASCGNLLCEAHDTALHSFRSRAAHVRTATEDAVGIPEQCALHFQVFKFFCLTCGSPVCRDCRECDTHEGHMIVFIVFTPPKKKKREEEKEPLPLPPLSQEEAKQQKQPPPPPAAKQSISNIEVAALSTTTAHTKQDETKEPKAVESKGSEEKGSGEKKASESQRRPAPQKPAPVKPPKDASASFSCSSPPALPASPTPSLTRSLSSVSPSSSLSPRNTTATTSVTPSPTAAATSVTPSSATPATGASVTAPTPTTSVAPAAAAAPVAITAAATTEAVAAADTEKKAGGEATTTTTPTTTSTDSNAERASTTTTTTTKETSSSPSASAAQDPAAAAKPAAAGVSAVARAAVFTPGQSVRALFDFSRSQKGYVTMTAREILTVVKSSPQLSATGWVLVKNVAGMHGYVPVNYVKAC